jgi:hypothetical protein
MSWGKRSSASWEIGGEESSVSVTVSTMGMPEECPKCAAEGSPSCEDDGVATPRGCVRTVGVEEGRRKGHFICGPRENPLA